MDRKLQKQTKTRSLAFESGSSNQSFIDTQDSGAWKYRLSSKDSVSSYFSHDPSA